MLLPVAIFRRRCRLADGDLFEYNASVDKYYPPNNMTNALKLLAGILLSAACINSSNANPGSVYTLKPNDPEAHYFTTEHHDGTSDVSDELQNAINTLKTEKTVANFANFCEIFPKFHYEKAKSCVYMVSRRNFSAQSRAAIVRLRKNITSFLPH